MCIDLFLSGPKMTDLQEYSRRRFDPSIEHHPGASKTSTYWKSQLGKPISAFQKFIHWNKTVHTKIHLSKTESIAFSFGSDNQIRIYSARDRKLLKTISLEEIRNRGMGELMEIVSVSDTHFVVGLESAWHRQKNENLGYKMFRPQYLFLLNLQGEVLAQYGTDLVIKGNVFLPEKNIWITADQQMLDSIPVPQTRGSGWSSPLTSLIHSSFATDHYVSAIAASKDGNTLYIGMSKSKHHAPTSEILKIDITNLRQPVLVETKTVEVSQIYSIEKMEDGRLFIKGSLKDAETSAPMVGVVVP